MENTNKTLALKPYLEQIRQYWQKQSRNELINLLCRLAQEIAPGDRAAFLKKICISPNQVEKTITGSGAEITNRIDYLKEDIMHRQESIEDGSYYDEHDAWDEYGYEEEPDPLSEDHKEDLKRLFCEADQFFLSGKFDLADKIYGPLLDWFNSGDDDFCFDLSDNDLQLNWRETRARHCRSVYEITAPAERVNKVTGALAIETQMFKRRYEPLGENHPSLQDVFDAAPCEPPGWRAFLEGFGQALNDRPSSRALVLRLEAVHLLAGTGAVAAGVRKKPTAIGYLFWLDLLMTENAWEEIACVAQEGLAKMPKGGLREQAAAILSLAGEKLADDAVILKGKREQFYSAPNDATLALLLTEAGRQNARGRELRRVWGFLRADAKDDQMSLKVNVLLMLGQLETAFKMIEKDKSLGWSYDSGGTAVFVAGLMNALTQADANATLAQALLKRYCESWADYYTLAETRINKAEMVCKEIQRGVKDIFAEDAAKKGWFTYLEKIIVARVDGIVSNKHRKAYDRAAEALGALMECFVLNGDRARADNLLETHRNQKYRRYPAFRREVDAAIESSLLLRQNLSSIN